MFETRHYDEEDMSKHTRQAHNDGESAAMWKGSSLPTLGPSATSAQTQTFLRKRLLMYNVVCAMEIIIIECFSVL